MWHFRLSGTKFLSTLPRLPVAELCYFCFTLETLQKMFRHCSDIPNVSLGGLFNNNNVMKASKFLKKSAIFIGYITTGWTSINLTDILAAMAWFLELYQRFINLNIKPFSLTEGKLLESNSIPKHIDRQNDRKPLFIGQMLTPSFRRKILKNPKRNYQNIPFRALTSV